MTYPLSLPFPQWPPFDEVSQFQTMTLGNQVVGNHNISALMSGHYMYQVSQEHIMIIKPSETLLQILQIITPWCQAIHYLTSRTLSLRRDREIDPRHDGTNAGP
jgi:hypothetical protein